MKYIVHIKTCTDKYFQGICKGENETINIKSDTVDNVMKVILIKIRHQSKDTVGSWNFEIVYD